MNSARFSPPTVAQRGQVARAMAAVQAQKPQAGEANGTMKCTRCGSTLKFTVFANGVSYGGCSAACGVRWPL